MPELRFGIIGAGAIGLEHIRNIDILEGARVSAVADTVPQSIEWAGEILTGQDVAYFSDVEELLASPDVDAVIIGTPNYTHIDVLRLAMASDKHLLCEKPLCTTIADCVEMLTQVAPLLHP